MSVLAVLLILSFFVSAGFVLAFFWAVNNGQFDDTRTPAYRAILPEADDPISHPNPQRNDHV